MPAVITSTSSQQPLSGSYLLSPSQKKRKNESAIGHALSKIHNFFSERANPFKRIQPQQLKERITKGLSCIISNEQEIEPVRKPNQNQDKAITPFVKPKAPAVLRRTEQQIVKEITLQDITDLRDYLISALYSSRLSPPSNKSIETISHYLAACQSISLSTSQETMDLVLLELETTGLICLKEKELEEFGRLLETPLTLRKRG